MTELERLIEVVARLRDPEHGCPWDSVQTNMSIRSYLVEEAGEYLDALEDGDYDAVRDELGDLLLQVVLNARIAEDEGRFNLEDVARGEADKMIRRHPHVFGESSAKTEEEYRKQWDKIKSTEKGYDQRHSAMDGVPRSFPGLSRGQKLFSRAVRAGLDELNADDALAKMNAAVAAMQEAVKKDDDELLEQVVGDALFSIIKLCHARKTQAEEIMHAAIKKYDRFYRKKENLELRT